MDINVINPEVFYAVVLVIGFWTMLVCLRTIAGEVGYHEARQDLIVRAATLRQEQHRKLFALQESRRQRSKLRPKPAPAPAAEATMPERDETADDVTFTQPGVEQANVAASSETPQRMAA